MTKAKTVVLLSQKPLRWYARLISLFMGNLLSRNWLVI
jgi:hypothetical protein